MTLGTLVAGILPLAISLGDILLMSTCESFFLNGRPPRLAG